MRFGTLHFCVCCISLAVAVTGVPAAAAVPPAVAETTRVQAVVVGVGDFPDAPLDHAVKCAEKVADAVRESYKGAGVSVSLLTDKAATATDVRKALANQLADAPPGSFLIFYFAGHGARKKLSARSDLYLRTFGTTDKDYYYTALPIRDVISAISGSRCSTAMILVDCCFSGQEELEIVLAEEEMRPAKVRAFMLCSSWSSEFSIGGNFTKALLEVWEKARSEQDSCLTPQGLRDAVRAKLVEFPHHEAMWTDLAFGLDLERCIAKLNSPSTLVGFDFPNGCRYPVVFSFSTTKHEQVYRPGKDHGMLVQLTKEPVTIVGKVAGQEVFRKGLGAKEMSASFVTVSVEFADRNLRNPDTTERIYALRDIADSLSSAGVDASSLHEYAASLALTAFPHSTDLTEAKKALRDNPNSLVFRIAAAERPRISDLTQLASRPDRSTLLTRIERLGNFDASIMYADVVTGSAFGPGVKLEPLSDFEKFRVFVSAKASDSEAANEVLQGVKLTPPQQGLVDNLRKLKSDDVRRVLPQLPSTDLQWQQTDGLPNLSELATKRPAGTQPFHVWQTTTRPSMR